MSKQDRQGVRLASDLERKYRFGKSFADQTKTSARLEKQISANEAENNAAMARESSVRIFMDNVAVHHAADHTVIRVYRDKTDGMKQFPFVYAPNGAGSGQQSTLDMNRSAGWMLAINAGVFDAACVPLGIVIQNGVVIQNASSTNKPLTIDVDGNLGYANSDADAAALAANGIVSAVCGFAPLVIDYSLTQSADYPSADNWSASAARQIIGQFGNGDYAVITGEAWTLDEAQAVCKELGLKFAYNLDGGSSTETVLGQKHMNTIYENETGRVVPTYLVFNGADYFNV